MVSKPLLRDRRRADGTSFASSCLSIPRRREREGQGQRAGQWGSCDFLAEKSLARSLSLQFRPLPPPPRHQSLEAPRPFLPHLGPKLKTEHSISRKKGALGPLARDSKGGGKGGMPQIPVAQERHFLLLLSLSFPLVSSIPCCLPALSRSVLEQERQSCPREEVGREQGRRERARWRQSEATLEKST